MGESHYSPEQCEYIASVGGGAHQSAIIIIGRLCAEVKELREKNAVLRAQVEAIYAELGNSLVLPLLSVEEIEKLEAAEAAGGEHG